jgi:hypothetical protein
VTNLLNLPQFPAGTTIAIDANADWTDQFFVPALGFPAVQAQVLGDLSASQFDTEAPGSITPGMNVSGYGVSPGTEVIGTSPIGTITFNQAVAVETPGVLLTFTAPPLDLTGITFRSTLRPLVTSSRVILSADTVSGGMVNGGAAGTFGWNIAGAKLAVSPWPPGLTLQGLQECVLDVVASDATGATKNLCAAYGPIVVAVALALTR